jgi:hypothetical protein
MAVPSINRPLIRHAGERTDRAATGTTGCAFAGRCQWQLGAVCDTHTPPWREVSPGHRIRCHIPLAELAERAKGGLGHLAVQPATAGN